ncbi:TadE/TadG family type IV pilus assembly protein [Massilia horti]|uniref:Pilus assembly protein n=1 Tax=Massilia horti TaxID=2562153 RepID=A0A4Y9SWH8_9BURK|nr:TadE family protein [Massilia horti]TFW29877.1 pilus assembly protein [Massilia horti]
MKKSLRKGRQRANGGVAVELAVLLPVIVLFVSVVLFFGRVFWHYTVAEKAAYDAVRFLASASAVEFRTQGPGGGKAHVAAIAEAIVKEEIAELYQGGPYVPAVDVLCDLRSCNGTFVPAKLTVMVSLNIADPFFDGITSELAGESEVAIVLNPAASMPYAEY